jgi:hypothetical protein
MPKLAAGAACLSSDQCSADCKGSNGCSGTCATAGVCSPLTVVQSLVLSVWCGLTPVRD